MHKILAVNPGSTSTKISCCIDDKKIFDRSIPIDDTLRASYKNIMDQLDLRYEQIWNVLCEIGETEHFDAVIGRGGLLAPMESGTYFVNSAMKEYLKRAPRGEHASNLGAFLASRFAEKFSCPAFIADPVSVDEMSETARISGAPEIERVSLVHA
ncbi:MAG: butyrate kinase, partial [Synergistaceae bacterium]